MVDAAPAANGVPYLRADEMATLSAPSSVVLGFHDILNLNRDSLGWCNGAERGCEDVGVCWRRLAC
jgi:hypothetical protein